MTRKAGTMGGGFLTDVHAESSEIRIVVTRANGDVEDLGRVAYWHRNPLKRWLWSMKHFFGKGQHDEL